MRWIRTPVWNGGDLWCLKIEEIKDYLFIDKSNKIKIGMNEMTVNDGKMSTRWNNDSPKLGQYRIYQSWDIL